MPKQRPEFAASKARLSGYTFVPGAALLACITNPHDRDCSAGCAGLISQFAIKMSVSAVL